MMNWLRFLMKRKILVGLMVTFILMLGSYSIFKLDQELFPSVNLGGAFVEVYAGDLPANEVEQTIAIPLEQRLLTIDGVEDVHSSSYQGRISFSIFTEEGKGDDVYPNIETEVNAEAASNDNIIHVLTAQLSTDQPYEFYMELSGGDLKELSDFATYILEPRLENLKSVRDVAFEGLFEQEIIISFDRNALVENGVDLQQVVAIIQEANIEGALGELSGEENAPILRWNSSIKSVEDLKNIQIASQNGYITLDDLASIELQQKESTSTVWKEGSKDFLFVQVGRTPDATQIEMADDVRAEIERIHEEGLVDGFELNFVVAQADYVKESLDGVTSNIMIGGILALVILLLFLRNLRATFIVGLSIPTSILLTFTAMWLLDYSFNILTLIGLGLGIGMMVDSSIVILESIYRKKELGLGNLESVIEGTKEVATAVIASMLTTIVVFIPIGLLGGEIGQFMIILSLVVAITLISSVVVAFTLIPSLSENFLKISKKQKQHSEGKITQTYGKIVEWVTSKKRRSLAVIAAFFVAFIGSMFLITKIPSTIMPDMLNRYNEIMINLEPGVTLQDKEEIVNAISDSLQDIQDVDTNFIVDNGPILFAIINMTKGDDITREQDEVNEEIFSSLRNLTEEYPIDSMMSAMDLSGGGMPVQVNVKGEDLETLHALTIDFAKELESIEGIVDVKTSVDRTSFEEVIQLDHHAIEEAFLTDSQIRQFIEQAFLQMKIGQLKLIDQTVDVNIQWDERVTTQSELLDLNIPTLNGERLLSHFVAFEQVEVPNEISRLNGERYISISANFEGNDLGSINREVQNLIKDFNTPNGYEVGLAGDLEEQQELMMEMLVIIGISIFLVYLVMAVQFNHLFHPIIVMSILPMTIVGVLIGLFITQRELSILSAMGIVMLIGIVLNNAILLIDRTKQLRNQGYNVSDALVEAGKNRLRPIFMTTLTTAFGMLPLAIATGSSGNYQAPMATVIISGLLFATLITLLLIPAVYRLFTSKKNEAKTTDQSLETEAS